MNYEDLTLNQRINLKSLFETREDLAAYKAIWLLINFKVAVELFFTPNVGEYFFYESF